VVNSDSGQAGPTRPLGRPKPRRTVEGEAAGASLGTTTPSHTSRGSYFHSVTSVSSFNTRFQAENGKNFSEINDVAASHWDRTHLLACRVVRREPQPDVLPVLSQHSEPSDVQASSDEIKAFVQDPDPTLMAQSEHSLVRGSGCVSLAHVWAALAMFTGKQDRRMQDKSTLKRRNDSEGAGEVETRQPKRLRSRTSRPEYVDSSRMRVDCRSPSQVDSGGSDGSSLGYVDIDTHYLGAPEDDTLRLAACVIRHILYFAPPQESPSSPAVVEFRDAKTRLSVVTADQQRRINAVDDGGLCLRRQKSDGGFKLTNNHIAILEAKKQFQRWENGKPLISDPCLAQMVCEALAVRLSDITDEFQERWA
jgi:hypothetical protein